MEDTRSRGRVRSPAPDVRCCRISPTFFFLEAVMRKSDLWASKCRFIVVIMWIYRCGNVDLCNVHDVTCRPGERGYQQGH